MIEGDTVAVAYKNTRFGWYMYKELHEHPAESFFLCCEQGCFLGLLVETALTFLGYPQMAFQIHFFLNIFLCPSLSTNSDL